MASNQLVIKNRSFLTKALKTIDIESFANLGSFMKASEEIQITEIGDIVSRMCRVEYGPALCLLDIPTLCKKLARNIREIRDFEDLIFCSLFVAIVNAKEDKYVMQDVCFAIMIPPSCILLEFGMVKKVSYVIHLSNRCLYHLGHFKVTKFLSAAELEAHKIAYSEVATAFEEEQKMEIISRYKVAISDAKVKTNEHAASATRATKQAHEYSAATMALLVRLREEQKKSIEMEIKSADVMGSVAGMIQGYKKGQHRIKGPISGIDAGSGEASSSSSIMLDEGADL